VLPSPRRSGIVEVARMAGVSRQTVSNVINDRAGYNEATRKRVEKAIKALGYRPDRAARSLRSRRTMQLAYHVPLEDLDPLNHPFAIGFLQALIRAADAKRYHILTFTAATNQIGPFEDLIAMRVADGFVLSNSAVDDPRAKFLAERRVPFVCMGRLASHLPQSWVDVDNTGGIASMVDYLIKQGHTDFAYVGYGGANYWDIEREAGFRLGLRRNGLSPIARSIVRVNSSNLHSSISRLLQRPTRPRTVVTGSDLIASVAFGVAFACGLTPGRDIAITGFDGTWLHNLFEPPLTTVRIPLAEIATALVQRCLEEIDLGPAGKPGLILPTEIYSGSSA
jgi:DNA-binding LacI/PurR family transcriptional regulator